MRVKKKTFYGCVGETKIQKAVSLALLLKLRLGRMSTLHNWSVNKLHNITGASPSTIKKYLPIMRRMGLVFTQGKNGQHLVVSRLSTRRACRNIDLSLIDFSSFKSTYNCFRAFIAMSIQAKKDFIRRTIQAVRQPSSYEELKEARRTMKRLVKSGAVAGMDSEYKEYGLSRKRIAEEIGNCIRTAHTVIKFAVNKGWWSKEQHPVRVLLSDICFRDTGGFFTYTTKNYMVLMQANTYTLNESLFPLFYPHETLSV